MGKKKKKKSNRKITQNYMYDSKAKSSQPNNESLWLSIKKDFIFIHNLVWLQHTWSSVSPMSVFLPRNERLLNYLSTALSTSWLDTKRFPEANFFGLERDGSLRVPNQKNRGDGRADCTSDPAVFSLPTNFVSRCIVLMKYDFFLLLQVRPLLQILTLSWTRRLE